MSINDETLLNMRADKELLTVTELARMYNCGRKKIDEACASGALPFFSPNGRVRFISHNDFIEWMKSNKV